MEFKRQHESALTKMQDDRLDNEAKRHKANCVGSSTIFGTTGTEILDLNEHCLLGIFEMKSLDLADLCALADTCKLFKELVNRVVPKQLQFLINGHDSFQFASKNHSAKTYKTAEVRKIFNKFKSLLTTFSIESHTPLQHDSMSGFLIAIFRKNLPTWYAEYFAKEIREFEPNFDEVQELYLKGFRLINEPTLFSGMDSLVDLRVFYVRDCGAILQNDFPNLERFEYEKDKIVMTDSVNDLFREQSVDIFTNFLSRHTKLKELLVNVYSEDSCQLEIMRAVARNCKGLQKFVPVFGRDISGASLHEIKKLISLENLRLQGTSFHNKRFELTELRALHLICCELHKDSFDAFIRLEELKIHSCSGSINAADIISHLPQLKELEILSDQFVLDVDTFSKIVDIVQDRPHVLMIKCRLAVDKNNYCNKNQNVKLN